MTWVSKCKDCGKITRELSHKRICLECALKRMKKCGQQIKKKKGKYWENYKKAMLKLVS